MKYNQPFGVADPNASYVDRNTPGATAGSRIPAAAVEHVQREIIAVITNAGLTPSAADLTQLLQAIDLKIAAITGEGDGSLFVLMDAARSRLPIFPEIASADGTFNLSAPATGTVRIPAGVEIVHRGIFSLTTAQQDFATAANKTYHLRWNPSGGWQLKDLADALYNPSALPETAQAFDSSFDSMITHRVVTNASNVASVIPLANKARMQSMQESSGVADIVTGPGTSGNDCVQYSKSFDLNWARTPVVFVSGFAGQSGIGGATPYISGWANRIMSQTVTRYGVTAAVQTDYAAVVTHSPIGGLRAFAVS